MKKNFRFDTLEQNEAKYFNSGSFMETCEQQTRTLILKISNIIDEWHEYVLSKEEQAIPNKIETDFNMHLNIQE